MSVLGDKLAQDAARFDAFLKSAARPVGQLAVREYVGSFKRQGWVNERGIFRPWKPREGERRNRSGVSGRIRYKRKAAESRAILVKSGQLRRSIRVTGTTTYSVTIGSNKPYAQRHNEGLDKMPQRQFMGYSKALNDDVIHYLDNGIRRLFAGR